MDYGRPSTPKSSNILNQVKPPPGRKVNHGALATYAGKVNQIRAKEEARVAALRKRTPDPDSDRQLAEAEDHLLGVRGECNAALRGAVERVAAGDDGFTVEASLTPEQEIDREERSDRNIHAGQEVRRPASIDLPWCGGDWTRLAPASLPRPEPVELSGGAWLPPTSRRRLAEASVRILCPAEHVEDEPAALSSETDAQRRARQAKDATAGWT